MSDIMNLTRKMELHYIFINGDNSHTLDAFTRNKCGDWNAYEQALYEWFTVDFLETLPHWPEKRMG